MPAAGSVGASVQVAALMFVIVAGELVCGESLSADTDAVFERVAGAPAVTTIVNTSLPPGGIGSPKQVTGLVPLHPAEAETNVTPAGRVSETAIPVAVAALVFETVIA